MKVTVNVCANSVVVLAPGGGGSAPANLDNQANVDLDNQAGVVIESQ